MSDTPRGFTIVELLVVVAIIGLLSAVILASVNASRQKARDARRREDLKQLQAAIELYYSDNGHYPGPTTQGSNTSEPLDAIGGFQYPGPDAWIPGLAPQYIAKLPRDPAGTVNAPCWSHYRAYLYWSDGRDSYLVLSHCAPEAPDAFSPSNSLVDPNRPTWAWKICAGAACTM